MYGYGVKAFTLSMIETAIQVTTEGFRDRPRVILGWASGCSWSPRSCWKAWRRRSNCRQALRPAPDHQKETFRPESKLARSGLAGLFLGVEIVSEKNVESYRRDPGAARDQAGGVRHGGKLAALRPWRRCSS